jgi:Holliday junction resolvase
MTEFERQLVNAFNDHFDESHVNGIAYRRKQHRFSSQFVDVLVDSQHPDFYLAIENKSLKAQQNRTLYFSQHFSESNDGHQVERITNFVEESGRTGYLALEMRRGRGKPRKAYLIPWDVIDRKYTTGAVGLDLEDIETFPEIERDGKTYKIRQAIEETV